MLSKFFRFHAVPGKIGILIEAVRNVSDHIFDEEGILVPLFP